MLATLVRFSIRFYGIVIALAVLILLYGIYRFATAGLDIFPEFSPKQVIIQTESSGLAAEQVEVLVTQPIETAISGLIGLVSVRSESIQGLSIVTVIFDENTDVYRNRQLVGERLTISSTVAPWYYADGGAAVIVVSDRINDRPQLGQRRSDAVTQSGRLDNCAAFVGRARGGGCQCVWR